MPDTIKVAKFGGSSVADAEAMRRCARIIADDPGRAVAVLSATSGTTNLLTSLPEKSEGKEREKIFREIEDNHEEIADDLKVSEETRLAVRGYLSELRETATYGPLDSMEIKDRVSSFGELISTTLFTDLLNQEGVDAVWVDARTLIRTDSQFGSAEPDTEAIRRAVEEQLRPMLGVRRVVTQGFIGSDPEGRTTTLGRGGSDFTAALLAEALETGTLEIWTDVDAIYTTDPRVVEQAQPITEITFDEAAELSVFGAKVLHPATLKPAIRKDIRVYVGSSIHPERSGTWIVQKSDHLPVIRAISLRRDQTLVTVHSLDMLHRHGFLAQLFQILADHRISVDLVTTSEVSVSLTIDTNHEGLRQRLSSGVIDELSGFADVEVEKGLVLIALVGNQLDRTAGVSGQLFQLLDEINIRLICHGASTHNLCFLVEEARADEVVQKLHAHFIEREEALL
ncbi:MAG: lysine-sensitive aspartokinase 3 [Bacteroidota bacterium]